MATKVARSLAKNVSQFEIPHTGIPIIIRPFVVKKANVVHPKVTGFQVDLKAQWLTKTNLREGLPPSIFSQDDLSTEHFLFLKERMEKSLLQTTANQKIGVNWKMNYDADLLESLFPSLLLQCWHLADNLKDSFLDFQPCIRTHWCRDHNFYQTMATPAYVVRTAKPLPLLEQDVNSTLEMDLPGPYRPVDLGVYSHPTNHLPNFPGYGAGCETPYPAIMCLSDFTSQNQEQMLHHGIHVMFSQLVAIAMKQGYHTGQHLEEPMTTKCVVTNGQVYMFMAYQLNTLSLQEDFGIKNIAWFDHFKTLYDGNSDPFKKGRKTFYEVFPTDTKRLKVNDEAIEALVAFLKHQTK